MPGLFPFLPFDINPPFLLIKQFITQGTSFFYSLPTKVIIIAARPLVFPTRVFLSQHMLRFPTLILNSNLSLFFLQRPAGVP